MAEIEWRLWVALGIWQRLGGMCLIRGQMRYLMLSVVESVNGWWELFRFNCSLILGQRWGKCYSCFQDSRKMRIIVLKHFLLKLTGFRRMQNSGTWVNAILAKGILFEEYIMFCRNINFTSFIRDKERMIFFLSALYSIQTVISLDFRRSLQEDRPKHRGSPHLIVGENFIRFLIFSRIVDNHHCSFLT